MKRLALQPGVVDDRMVELSRGMSAGEITALVSGMFSQSRDRLLSYVRQEHPEWSEQAVREEVIGRIHGPGAIAALRGGES